MNLSEYIEIVSDKRFGRTCIKGTRIAVYDILGLLGSGMTNQEIIEDFPQLTTKHIQAALLFAAKREHYMKIAS